MKPAEKVLFLGVGEPKNEYLSLFLCAVAGRRTFNASGNKTLHIAAKTLEPAFAGSRDCSTKELDALVL